MTGTVDDAAAANVAGVDPHKRTLSVTVLDHRGGVLGSRAFKVSGDGHRAMQAWAIEFGPITTWGVEGASALGRHTAVFLAAAGYDVRDVCPTRTAEQARRRRQGKTDALDAERIAREVLADPNLPAAFKRAHGNAGPDPVADQIALWHKARRSILTSRQHLLNEAESILIALPEQVQEVLGDHRDVRRRLDNLDLAAGLPLSTEDPVVALRLRPLRRPRTSPTSIAATPRQPSSSQRSLPRSAQPSTSSQAWPPSPPRSSSTKSATPADSPKAASPGSTGPPRCPRLQARETANPSGTD